ncbi:ATP-binding cassette domain-containing protein, partial [Mesorhizobium sp. M00.F.Ca.ET.186.01.1.1]
IDAVLIKDTNPDELAAKMVGREVSFHVDKTAAKPQGTILAVENVTAMGNRGVNALNNLSLEVRAGEILGIAGVDGNGQSELIEVLTGLRKATSGRVLLNGKEITNESPR